MPRPRKRSTIDVQTSATDYRHAEKRKNIPPAQIASEGQIPKSRKVKYAYSPHLDPILRFDPTGRADKVKAIVEKACAGKALNAEEKEILRSVGEQWSQPWLEWAGKQEEQARGHFEVDPIALHIHERISSRAILANALRQDAERSLFADPEQSYAEAVQFYKHDVDWANRMILGDSLQVMSSLAHRENLAGKVQTIYFDPPYGIDFGSNFQPTLGQTDVIDGSDRDLTREPETIKAFRDTWHIGAHSYLSYVRSRVRAAHALLAASGSIFVQISDVHLHRVREILDEVFGAENSLVVITVKKKSSTPVGQSVADYLVWYCKDKAQALMQRVPANRGAPDDSAKYTKYELPSGERRSAHLVPDDVRSARPGRYLRDDYPIVSQHPSPTRSGSVRFEDTELFPPRNGQWRFDPATDMRRLYEAGRLRVGETTAFGVSYWGDESLSAMPNVWTDTHGESSPIYVVQTNRRIVERCILMTSRPGDLVLDPTCGSGTAALVAEKWGRRWITIDTSRISIALARQRLLTERFDAFKIRDSISPQNPAFGFKYKTVPIITLKSIAQNEALDPIIAKHAPILAARLKTLNDSLAQVAGDTLRACMVRKFASKVRGDGVRQITDSDLRRWLLPGTRAEQLDFGTSTQRAKWLAAIPPSGGWREWEVPFEADSEWPESLKASLADYRSAWQAKRDEVDHCIEVNAEPEDLVTEPEKVAGVTRVSGPFTVEGVMPEELALTEDGVVDLTPNDDDGDSGPDPDAQNRSAYLKEMTYAIKRDGVLFPNNQKRMFSRVEPLYENHTLEGIHAEAAWEGEDDATVAICFGPQYGPVTAYQVEELIRATKRYAHLVVAGFSFDPEATAIIEQSQHPKLKIHMAHIRPDMNPGMRGLLKDTPNSQLFTVFGMPAVDVTSTKDGEWQARLEGVDIYDPVENTVRSTKADKVAAWFLDSDFDGRCFCICQAFFPDQDAWAKIAKSLGGAADPEAFAAFKGTTSLAFKKGKHARIAVKVIDPRGNEVMTVRKLEG